MHNNNKIVQSKILVLLVFMTVSCMRPDSSFVEFLKSNRTITNSEFKVNEKQYSIAFIPSPENEQWFSVGSTDLNRLFFPSVAVVYNEIRILLLIKIDTNRELKLGTNAKIMNNNNQVINIDLERVEASDEYSGFTCYITNMDEIRELRKIINGNDGKVKIIGGSEEIWFGIGNEDIHTFNKTFALLDKIISLKNDFEMSK